MEPIRISSLEDFLEEYWEKSPIVVRNLFPGTIVEEKDIFNSMVNSGDDGKKRLWINGELISEIKDYLPVKEDANIDNYIKRISGGTFQNEVSYSQINIQKYLPTVWGNIKGWVEQIINIIGIPTNTVDMDTFLGRYSSTPIGIHTDQAGTFMHVVHGTKKMLVWPPNYFEDKDVKIIGSELRKTIINCTVSNYIQDAIVLEGKPGDTLYWPSSHWHISISEDSSDLTVIMNIGFFFGEKKDAMLSEVTSKLLNYILNNFHKVQNYSPNTLNDGKIFALPDEEINYLKQFRELINSSQIEEILMENWYKQISASGFTVVPNQLNEKIQNIKDKEILRYKNSTIYYYTLKKSIYIFANGYSFKYDYNETIIRLLDLLSSKEMVLYEEIYKKENSKQNQELISSVLNDLHSARCIYTQD